MNFKILLNIKTFFTFSLLILLLIINSGCTDLRQAIGKEKYVPDEYSVMKTPSLIIPPGFGIDADSFKTADGNLESSLKKICDAIHSQKVFNPNK